MTHDNADQVTSTTDARGKKLVHLYDALGRKRVTYENQLGGPVRAQWVYDTIAKGKLSQSTRMVGTAPYQVKVLGYTDNYQSTGMQVVIPASETGLGDTYNVNYTYNVDGSLASYSLPETGGLPAETLFNHYDSGSGLPKQLTTLYGTEQSSYVADTDYNALGQVDQYELYTGLYSGTGARLYESYTRELETGRLTGVRSERDSTAPYTLSDVRYTYDQVGKITKIADVAATGGVDNQCFRYDYLGRLTEAWTPANGECGTEPTVAGLGGPARYWLSWTLDAAGNRRSETEHGNSSGDRTTIYAYPAAGSHQPHALTGTTTTSGASTITAAYTYDEAGNTLTRPTAAAGTQTLTWDPEGRLATSTDSTGTTSYIYDADGNRLIRQDPTGKTLYLPGQELRFTTSTATQSCTRYYTFNGQTIASRTTTGLTWLVGDHQGTGQVAVDAVSQQATIRRQTPYGTPRGPQPTWPNSRGFVGGTVDNTGLTHLGAREYDPTTGRFISVDPVFNADAPEQMNGYAYAANSPVTNSDPTGLEPSGGSWMYIGSDYWTKTSGGYRYHYRADYYLYCRYGGAFCLGGYGNQTGWINMAYAGLPGVWLLARVVVYVWRVAVNFIGPLAGPPKPRVTYPSTPACPRPPVPEPKGELDGPTCDFLDFKCLFSGKEGAKAWWRGNRSLVTGGAGMVGLGLCLFATAGICAIAGYAGFGVAFAGRALDLSVSRSGLTGDNITRFGMGVTIDAASSFIPGVRSFKTTGSGLNVVAPRGWRNSTGKMSLSWRQEFTPKGTLDRGALGAAGARAGGQLAWFGVSGPEEIAKWQMGIPFTDPFQWG